MEVQHCTALTVTSVCFIQPLITVPSFAILINVVDNAIRGHILADLVYVFSTAGSSSLVRAMRPKISDRLSGFDGKSALRFHL